MNPIYYQSKNIQAIDVIEAFDLNFNKGNVVKYVLRAGKKEDNDIIQDLKKAHWYIEREIERIEKNDWKNNTRLFQRIYWRF